MDVYVVDRYFHRRAVVDYYISFIWTERYSAKGDFELIVDSNQSTRNLFNVGQYVSVNESDRLMEILEVEDTVDEEGRQILNVKGYSLEHLLEDRIALSPGATAPPWWWRTFRTPQSHARNLYREICYDNIRDDKNNFSVFDIDETPEPGRIPEPAEPQQFEFKPMILYDAIQQTCQGSDLGFSLTIKNQKTMHEDARPIVYKVYTGRDRTTTQTTHTPVVFSPDLDNLKNTKSLTTSVNEKNVAIVFCGGTFIHVRGENVPPNAASRGRRVLMVEMDDDTALSGADLLSLMHQRGREALAEHRTFQAFDGEIEHYDARYVYGRDYGLGDLVEMRNIDGLTNQMMVTEQIFVSDAEGHRWYPTLTLFEFVQPGSWIAWNQNIRWGELTDEEWQTMP